MKVLNPCLYDIILYSLIRQCHSPRSSHEDYGIDKMVQDLAASVFFYQIRRLSEYVVVSPFWQYVH